jgi:hypothetical protein
MCRLIVWIAWFASWRVIVIVNGDNAPAWMFVEPPVIVGSNGSGADGQPPPLGPLVTWNGGAETLLGVCPDQELIVAFAV